MQPDIFRLISLMHVIDSGMMIDEWCLRFSLMLNSALVVYKRSHHI